MSADLTDVQKLWLDQMSEQTQRASAAMPEVIEEMRRAGLLRPLPRRKWPKRQPRIDDADYLDGDYDNRNEDYGL